MPETNSSSFRQVSKRRSSNGVVAVSISGSQHRWICRAARALREHRALLLRDGTNSGRQDQPRRLTKSYCVATKSRSLVGNGLVANKPALRRCIICGSRIDSFWWRRTAIHSFFESHSAEQVHDCRRIGIKFGGYSIRRNCCQRTRKWHTLVRLDKPTYVSLRAYLLELAVRRDQETLEEEFRSICFQPYRPVREQLLAILRAVNRKRKAAGLSPLDYRCVPSRRRITKPFGEQLATDAASSSCYSMMSATGSTGSGSMRPSS